MTTREITFNTTVSEPWFTLIKKKKKTIEGRLNKGTFNQLKTGDIVKFMNGNDSFNVKIRKIKHYKTFEEYLTMEGIRRTLPMSTIRSIKEGCDIYYQYYTREQEQQYGIIAIYIKKI